MRILITGTTGFVGHELKASYTDAIAAPSLRNATRDMIMKIVEESEADVVIRTALIVISLLTLWYTARKIRKAHILQMCRYRCIWLLHVRTES